MSASEMNMKDTFETSSEPSSTGNGEEEGLKLTDLSADGHESDAFDPNTPIPKNESASGLYPGMGEGFPYTGRSRFAIDRVDTDTITSQLASMKLDMHDNHERVIGTIEAIASVIDDLPAKKPLMEAITLINKNQTTLHTMVKSMEQRLIAMESTPIGSNAAFPAHAEGQRGHFGGSKKAEAPVAGGSKGAVATKQLTPLQQKLADLAKRAAESKAGTGANTGGNPTK